MKLLFYCIIRKKYYCYIRDKKGGISCFFQMFHNKEEIQNSEKVFEGIAKGRKKALDNWFNDTWVALELTRDTVVSYLDSCEAIYFDEIIEILEEKRGQFKDFSELFIINKEGIINVSTSKSHLKKDIISFLIFLKV